jgi:hypothetical protein
MNPLQDYQDHIRQTLKDGDLTVKEMLHGIANYINFKVSTRQVSPIQAKAELQYWERVVMKIAEQEGIYPFSKVELERLR